jgi:hypothetical protein
MIFIQQRKHALSATTMARGKKLATEDIGGHCVNATLPAMIQTQILNQLTRHE